MTDAVQIRTQAAKCATLAKQTDNEESRQRYLRLEKTYLHLAESGDQLGQMGAFVQRANRRPQLKTEFAAAC